MPIDRPYLQRWRQKTRNCDFDGVVAAEIRLWHALERQLPVPFEYYGLSDNTDLRQIRWSRGAYQSEDLDKLYTGDDRRAALVIKQTARRVGNPQDMRALGFCVSVSHAEFMAEKFRQAGIPAIAMHGKTPPEERLSAPRRLEQREVNVIFTCDLYIEGFDLPFVDTLLFIRPTESATLFMQQLGRGLRLHDAKETCLVLDFIGQHREEFRFDKVLRAMTGLGRGALRPAVDAGFPLLPTGCHLQLDRVAREQILAGLQRSLRGGLRRLVAELRAISASAGPDLDLRTFLAESGRDLEEVFDAKLSWSQLRQAAGLPCPPDGAQDHLLRGKIKQILHLDDPVQLAFYREWLTRDDLILPNVPLASPRALMLVYQLFHEPERVFSV